MEATPKKPACHCLAHKADPAVDGEGCELKLYGMLASGYKWHDECWLDNTPESRNRDCPCCEWLYRVLY